MGASCLLIHGFTGTPHELSPLTDLLEQRGHHVVTPVLAGHGGSRQDMDRVSWIDWIHSAEIVFLEQVKQHGPLHLVGFSMGGLIAAYLTSKYPDKVVTLTTLSAPIYMINPKQIFKSIAEAIQKSMRAQGRSEDMTRYLGKVRNTPFRSLAHLRRLVQTVRPIFDKLEVPLLVAQGNLDDLVEPSSAQYIFDHARSTDKQLHFFSQSGHMICHDCETEQVCQLVTKFIEDHDQSLFST
ncbi:MAG: alpha/beta fold hydrolase [Tumebacillaceae bacterium]